MAGMKNTRLPVRNPLRALAALLLALPLNALAWGPQGHRLVAELAWEGMTPAARAEAGKLLAGEPDPTLPGIANWADELRAHDPDLGKRSSKWHYVNLAEDECHYDAARDCPNGNCAVAAIAAQTAILADRSKSQADRLQALKFVVHLVGDVHQPLHAGYARDKGGNDFQLAIPGEPERPGGYGGNLHSLWDSSLLNTRKRNDAAYLAELRKIAVPTVTGAGLPADAAGWAEDSCKLMLQPGFYPPTHKLEPGYVATWRPLAETQLRLGGEHLAEVLNAALAPGR
ncbi:S1/P1 Nuclease family protein [Lysobacter gummosus]|nr:S1/P1 Nuclease family protein [Lysobacter gummosus]